MNSLKLEQKIIDQLGIDNYILPEYSNDIKKISLEIGDNNVLAKNDSIYNKDLSYVTLKTIVGSMDTYYIVKFN